MSDLFFVTDAVVSVILIVVGIYIFVWRDK